VKKEPESARISVESIEAELSRTKQKRNYNKAIADTLRALVVVAAVAVLLSTLWLPVFQIYGNSMENTLTDGDVVVSVKEGAFRRGDVVAFYYNNKILLKRVIAVGGETVDVRADGTVFVDGEPLEEPYVLGKSLGECNIELPYKVPDSRLFVMGDSRAKSVDSRVAAVGAVSAEQVVGKVILRVWPLSKFGAVD
jgi:signal peptidase I